MPHRPMIPALQAISPIQAFFRQRGWIIDRFLQIASVFLSRTLVQKRPQRIEVERPGVAVRCCHKNIRGGDARFPGGDRSCLGGAATGALIIMSPKKVLVDMAKGLLACLKGAPHNREAYEQLLSVLYELFLLGRRLFISRLPREYQRGVAGCLG